MPTEQPWVMGVQADTADANDRDDLARSVRERIAAHSDWILLNTCHRVELYGFGHRQSWTRASRSTAVKARSGI
jgi:glutamyl-tRNA reductase